MTSPVPSSPWVLSARARPGARIRLFCFHHAGGGASFFRTWADALPDEIELYPVQLPGRENRARQAPFSQFDALMQELVPALRPYLTMPFAFFGHSLGALLSYTLTLQLRRQGGPQPIHLFASAYRAPQLPNLKELHTLSDDDLVETLIRFNGTDQEILANNELSRFFLPILRADFSVCETYIHADEETLDCPISVFGGLQDTRVSREALQDWQALTSQSFVLRMFPGDHFFLQEMRLPLIQLIARELLQARAN
jgi:medium-chain acyl-[acyl-carrier-protein] hydrolase